MFAPQPLSPTSYEADVRRFIDCTNHKHALHSIRTTSFAYHERYPSLPSNDDDSSKALPNRPAILITLRLSLKRPFYSLTIDSSLGREKDKVQLARALEDVDERIRGIYELERRGSKFSKVIVDGVTSAVLSSCRRCRIGEWGT